jgi:hypothetical protein
LGQSAARTAILLDFAVAPSIFRAEFVLGDAHVAPVSDRIDRAAAAQVIPVPTVARDMKALSGAFFIAEMAATKPS